MAIGKVLCIVCGSEFNGSSSATFCSNKCKQKSYRTSRLLSGFIYKLKRDGVIVYVGQSHSESGVKNRMHQHACGEYPKVFDDYEFYKVDGKNLNEVEADEIIKHKPIYNRVLPSNSKYITIKQFSKKLSGFVEDAVSVNCDLHSLGDGERVYSTYINNDDFNEFEKMFLDTLVGMKITRDNCKKRELDRAKLKESKDELQGRR